MAKVIIPLGKLPFPGKEGRHKVRFRITTKDYNEISDWSPVIILESVGQKNAASVEYNLTVMSEIGPYEVNWDPEIYIPSLQQDTSKKELQNYDIFVQLGSTSTLQFYNRVVGNTATIYHSVPIDQIRVVCQLPTYPFPPTYKQEFKIFDTGLVTIWVNILKHLQ